MIITIMITLTLTIITMMTRNIEDNIDDVLKMTTVTMVTMRCSSDQFVNNFLLGVFFYSVKI